MIILNHITCGASVFAILNSAQRLLLLCRLIKAMKIIHICSQRASLLVVATYSWSIALYIAYMAKSCYKTFNARGMCVYDSSTCPWSKLIKGFIFQGPCSIHFIKVYKFMRVILKMKSSYRQCRFLMLDNTKLIQKWFSHSNSVAAKGSQGCGMLMMMQHHPFFLQGQAVLYRKIYED